MPKMTNHNHSKKKKCNFVILQFENKIYNDPYKVVNYILKKNATEQKQNVFKYFYKVHDVFTNSRKQSCMINI